MVVIRRNAGAWEVCYAHSGITIVRLPALGMAREYVEKNFAQPAQSAASEQLNQQIKHAVWRARN